MNVEEARVAVIERLGASWLLGRVTSKLVPGPFLGSPTEQAVEVELDYHPGGRPDISQEGHHVWATGPHLVFVGTGSTIEDALSVAMGQGLAHDTVQYTGSEIAHAATQP